MTKKTFILIFISSTIMLFLFHPLYAQFDSSEFNKKSKPLEITRITPSGKDVPPKRQIVFKFNMPVVPVGRMERTSDEIPITITPALRGQWRWLNTSSLALQLGDRERMKKSTRYTINIKPDFAAHSKNKMEKGLTHSFTTVRPQVRHYYFQNWKAPGHPVIRVDFNQKIDRQNAVSHVRLVSADGRKTALVEGKKTSSHYGTSINVEPVSELPLDSQFHLKIEPGVISEEGPEKGIENRIIVTFHTFPAFQFLGIRGYNNTDQKVIITPRGKQDVLLSPLKNASLLFSCPVPARMEGPKLTFSPDLAGGRTDYNPWADASTGSYMLRRPHKKGNKYEIYLPEVLKAAREYRVSSSRDFKDIFGRPLLDPINMIFKTSHRPSSLYIKNSISVLEKHEDTHLPLVITNLKQIRSDYRLLKNPRDFWLLKDLRNCGHFNADQKYSIKTDDVEDIAYAFPFRIRDILNGKSGALAGVLTTEPRVKNGCNLFFSQVTNLAVHVKLGHHNTNVWVTRLDNGEPVANADVELFLHGQETAATRGVTNQNGVAELKGTVTVDPFIKYLRNDLHRQFGVIRVSTQDDSAILPLIYDFTDSYYYYGSNQIKYSYMRSWGITSQGIYRAGDTVDFKIFVRNQDNRRYVTPKLSPYRLEVEDPTGKIVHEQDKITLTRFGSFNGSFKLSKGAVSGWYRFNLNGKFGKNPGWQPIYVLVTDFTPAPFKVKTDIKSKLFKIGDLVEIETSARLHSGGPYGNAGARITATITPTYFRPSDPIAKKFYFMNYRYGHGKQQVFYDEKELDEKGDLKSQFTIKETRVVSGRLTFESAVRDDRGKYVASSAAADFMGRDRLVGLRHEQWILKEDEETEFKVLVVDEKGKPAAGSEIRVIVEYDRVTGTRVKGAGNAYLMQYDHKKEEVKKLSLISEEKPITCKFTPREPGTYYITANIQDQAGRAHSIYLQKYAVGKGRILWEMPDDNSLTIIPAQDEYKVGDKARFLIKNPYPGARALITIERLGVMKKWTQVLTSNTPVIEFDIEADFVPGFFLSIVLMSPRVDKPLDENNVDLGKPACRIGSLTVIVNDPYKMLNIKPNTDRKKYKPGSKVTLDIHVSDINNNHPDTEVAVVVLDEAVLDLLRGGTHYYDPYKGFYTLGYHDVKNYNLLFRLVGRQKFEKKGANSGGGGGGSDVKMRSVFKYVSYWNPSIHPDKNGHASVSFTLPDNLTGWRVLTLAVTENDLMGLGQTRFVTNKPTEIRPALPNQVTEGDSFEAVFTVMNRTENPRDLNVQITADGKGVEATPVNEKISAEPYVRNKVRLPVITKKHGQAIFNITAGDSFDQDGLVLPLTIHKKQAIEAAATYGTTIAASVSEYFKFPENMREDTGKVSIVVSPSIISSLEGAFDYMKRYPYYCWEQRLSKGIMAMHYISLKQYIAESFEWKTAKDTVTRMISDAGSFQAPNGGMCYYIPQDQYASPYLSAYTAIAFNWMKQSGYTPDNEVEKRLHKYLQNLLRRDSFPSFFSRGMSSTVRAVALAALAQNNKVSRGDLKRYLPHVEYMDLFGKAHYLLAAVYTPGTQKIQSEVYDKIMSHANETGGKVIFSDSIYGENIAGGFGRILSSEIRTNAAVLSALIAMEEKRAQISKQDKIGRKKGLISTDSAFKIVRYLTQSRKNRDHWENTQENAFCMQALTSFSRIYDTDNPKCVVTAVMDKKDFGRTSFNDFKNPPHEFKRPVQQGDPGRETKVIIKKDGPGRLYYSARLFYSPKDLKLDPVNSGIEVHREYYLEKEEKWVLLETPMSIKQGDIVRVDLFVSIPSARNFVVVADPVPGGLEPVNRDLATSSTVDADKDAGTYAGSSWWHKYGDWSAYGYSRWSFYHKEMLHHSVRFYSDYLPAGNYHLSYVAQAIAPGEFYAMPLHAEEMYDPDVFGQGVPGMLKVDRME